MLIPRTEKRKNGVNEGTKWRVMVGREGKVYGGERSHRKATYGSRVGFLSVKI
jgi:hypothetical protein